MNRRQKKSLIPQCLGGQDKGKQKALNSHLLSSIINEIGGKCHG